MDVSANPMIPLNRLMPRTLDWLWPNRLALGKLAMFDGDPGRGKSLVTLDLCARVTTGRPMPDGTGQTQPSRAAIIQAEDDAEDTVMPRLSALGADLDNIFVFGSDSEHEADPFSLPSHTARLDRALEANKPRLVVIDPIMAFLDRNVLAVSDQSVRRALSPLARLAEKHHCAMILVRHMNKKPGSRAMYRGGGSIGFNAACRSSWLFAADPDDPTRLVMAEIKNNLAGPQPALAYRVHRRDDAPPLLEWLGPTSWTAEQLLYRNGKKPIGPTPREKACTFLASFLEAGPRPTLDIWQEAQRLGLKKRTMRYARHCLSIRSLSVMTDNKLLTWWLMPGQTLPDSIPPEQRPDDIEDLLAPLRARYPGDPLDDIDEVGRAS